MYVSLEIQGVVCSGLGIGFVLSVATGSNRRGTKRGMIMATTKRIATLIHRTLPSATSAGS